MVLRADDGTPLEIKEPIILDSEGESQDTHEIPQMKVRSNAGFSEESPFDSVNRTFYFSSSRSWLTPFILVLVIAVLVFGTVFAGAFVALLVCVTLVKGFFRLLKQLFQV